MIDAYKVVYLTISIQKKRVYDTHVIDSFLIFFVALGWSLIKLTEVLLHGAQAMFQ